jgi:uncharacterized protein (TIGR03546 family)
MLTLLKLVRNLFKQLKSDLTPAQIAVGAFLGAMAGLTPLGPHLLVVFTVALLVNCSMAACLLVFGALKPVGFALAGASFKVGASLLQDGQGPYASVIRAVAESPILAYLGFDRYIVAGGYALAIPVALALALIVHFGVAGYRKKLTPKLADSAWFQNAMKNRLFRFFRWVIAGKEKELVEPKKRFILLRPFRAYMVGFIPLLYVGITVGAGLYAQAAVGGLAAPQLSKALGVQCSFGKIEYSFFAQRLAFENFQLPDPSNTKEDMVRVGGFEADLGFISLLSKRLHIEKLAVRDIAVNAARKEDGKLNLNEVVKPEDPSSKSAWEDYTTWLTDKGRDADWSELWKKYQEYRRKSDEQKKEDAARKARGEKTRVELAYDSDLRWDPERSAPLVRIDLIEIKNFALRMTDRSSKSGALPALTSIEAQGSQISSRPGWNNAPLTLSGAGLLDEGKSGKLSFRVSWLPAKSELEFKVDGVPIADWRAAYEKTLPVNVDAGMLALSTKAGINSRIIDGQISLKIERLKVSAKPGQKPILGLSPEMSGYAIQGINAYGEKLPVEVGAAVTGPMEDPTVQAKVSFLEIAKKGLEMLGRKELQKVIDALGGEVDTIKKAGLEKLSPVTGDAQKAVEGLKAGDTKAVDSAVKKAQTDVKSLPDAKKDLEKKADDLKDLFKKK